MTSSPSKIRYSVPAMSCGHCVDAITKEVSVLAGVNDVAIDLETKLVTISGNDLDDAALRAAIDEAGFDVASSEAGG